MDTAAEKISQIVSKKRQAAASLMPGRTSTVSPRKLV